ncbi:hypothetical protein Pan258_60210 [Symmachiella dynata]|nr:hypothetical protein Pan258_60210 [Symmachiella dynata]
MIMINWLAFLSQTGQVTGQGSCQCRTKRKAGWAVCPAVCKTPWQPAAIPVQPHYHASRHHAERTAAWNRRQRLG